MGFLSNYFNLEKSFVFYGAYHNESRNKVIHMIFIPVIFTTSLTLARNIHVAANLTLPALVTGFYALSFIIMEPVAGLLYAPVLYGMHHVGTKVLGEHPELALGLWVLGWVAQFIGHGVFEKRKPALLDNLFQSIHAAVFFAWLEWLFAFGYRPELLKTLEKKVNEAIAKLPK